MPRWDVTVAFEGPSSSTDNAVARFNSTCGSTVQDSGVTISDCNDTDFATGNVVSGGTWSVDVDATGCDGACLSAAGTFRFGASQDLRIYHGGTNNYVTGVAGDLIIGTQGSGAGIILDAEDDTLEFKQSGTVKAIFNTDGLLIKDQLDLRLEESGSGCSYIAMQAAACMAANYTITWPAAVAGTCGFALKSTTAGVLSWGAAGAAQTNAFAFFIS